MTVLTDEPNCQQDLLKPAHGKGIRAFNLFACFRTPRASSTCMQALPKVEVCCASSVSLWEAMAGAPSRRPLRHWDVARE